MSTFLSLGSLLFGIVAWALPIVALKRREKGLRATNYSFYSAASCTIALILQLFEVKSRVNLGDWDSLMDTTGATCVAAVILVAITFVLNLMENACAAKAE